MISQNVNMSYKPLQEIKLFLWNDFSGLCRIHYNRVTIHREDDDILSCGIDIRKMVISLQNRQIFFLNNLMRRVVGNKKWRKVVFCG